MRLGLTMRVVSAAGYTESRDAISHDWIRLFQEQGWSPRLIPNRLNEVGRLLDDLDGLILTGGNDISADLSGLPASSVREPAPERDHQERKLLQESERRRVPVLGICRGLQMINCHYGGRLVEVDSDSHAGSTHSVRFLEEPWQSLWGERVDVNSYHDRGIAPEGAGRDLVPFSLSGDGTVEGLYHRNLPVLGIMWHPERCENLGESDGEFLGRFFGEVGFWNREGHS